MPAVSKAQQRLMAQAYGIKTKAIKPSELNPLYKKTIMDLADSMTKKELEKYASTKHKGLPDHVEEALEESADGSVIGDLPSVMEPVTSGEMPKFQPHGPGKIIPYLDPEAKQKKKGKKNLENLKDYRDWISQK
jgi:hypothetical protein